MEFGVRKLILFVKQMDFKERLTESTMRTKQPPILLAFLSMFLLMCLAPFQKTYAQVTAPRQVADSTISSNPSNSPDTLKTLEEQFYALSMCQSEYYGPMKIHSHGWALVDTLIQTKGKDAASDFFTTALHKGVKAVQFYALIGIYKTLGDEAYTKAKSQTSHEKVLVQKDCLMMLKSIEDAADAVLFDRF